jgi:3-phenylpropionate/trans-cinnamate dioxygenase ferredoxin reductase subunit
MERIGELDRPLRRVTVVGCSLAGLRACEELRALGYDGELTVIGEETHDPYDRPPLSKQFLAGQWDLDRIALRPPDKIEALEVDLRRGVRATRLDLTERKIELSDGTSQPFDGLVIATGSTPRTLPGAPAGAEGLHFLRTLDDGLALRRLLEQPGARLVVIGAGFIGSEVASTAHGAGAEVTVIEASEVPLVHALGEEMGQVCAGLHRDAGIDLRLGVGVERILASDQRVTGIKLADGSMLEADAVVIGVGVTPATAWLEGSGLRVGDGIICDETLHAAPGVVAAGDVTRWPHPLYGREMRLEHWENAVGQGAHAAASLLAGAPGAEAFGPVPYFWSDQYGTKIQLVGDPLPGDEVRVVEGSAEERRFVAVYGRDGRLVAALAFARPRHLMMYRKLVEARASFEEALAYEPG